MGLSLKLNVKLVGLVESHMSSQIGIPIRIKMPKAITTQLPNAKVTDCNFGDKRLWARPLISASTVCQEREAEKAPITKSKMSMEDAAVPALNPSMSVVKYATVTGLSNVNPKNIP